MPITEIQVIPIVEENDLDKSVIQLYSNYVSNLFTYYLNSTLSKGLRKVLIELNQSDEPVEPILNYSSGRTFCQVHAYFNYSKLKNLSDYDLKLILSQLLKEILLTVSREFEWKTSIIEGAFDSMKEDDFSLMFYLKKPKYNKGRSLKAGIFVEFGLESANLYLQVNDKNEASIFRFKLFETLPSEFIYNQLIGGIKWQSNTNILFFTASKEIEIDFDIFAQTQAVTFSPYNRNTSGLLDELKFLSKNNVLPSWISE